jgi:D-tyrosyl-tRNA(Tyr) deacylase
MRAVIQRVTKASVSVDGQIVGAIGRGVLVLLGVAHDDDEAQARWLAEKVVNLRLFEDDAGKLNLSLLESGGEILVVSQFTLYGDCRKGRRPSFAAAAEPQVAKALYERFVDSLKALGPQVSSGVFQAHMAVELVNDGPVTLIVDTPER